ncbi:MAG: DUF4013 domain-containing protein [Acidobacteriota bacterium]|nr:DUF4013 domain-containing protein [Acidobacteriota bacterium]
MSSAFTAEPPPPPTSSPAQFDFLRPFTYVFDDPRWIPKILLGGVFSLAAIFLVGIFFIYGYLARLARNVINGVQYPLPEWDDIGEYFTEGVKLFVVGLIYAIPVILVVCIAIIPAAILSANGNDNETLRSLGGMTATCVWCLVFPLSLAMALWLPAALLSAIVTGEFSAAFQFANIWKYIRANIGNYLLAFVVWLVARFAAGFGVLLLCIGIVFTMFWAFCVAAYAFAQVYRMSSVKLR